MKCERAKSSLSKLSSMRCLGLIKVEALGIGRGMQLLLSRGFRLSLYWFGMNRNKIHCQMRMRVLNKSYAVAIKCSSLEHDRNDREIAHTGIIIVRQGQHRQQSTTTCKSLVAVFALLLLVMCWKFNGTFVRYRIS